VPPLISFIVDRLRASVGTFDAVVSIAYLGMHPPTPIPLILDDAAVIELRRFAGLDYLSHLAADVNLTSFEKVLQEALLLHSRATATSSPADKLAFVMVALETLLLRDSNEPIQQCAGDRFAFLLVKDPASRQNLARLFRST
jgi:hypothetical protein